MSKGSIHDVPLESGEVHYKAYIDVPGNGGERNQETKTFKTREEADRWLTKMNFKLNEQIHYEPSEMLLEEYLDTWLNRIKNGLATRTVEKYQRAIGHVSEELGGIPLNKLTPYHIQSYYETKLENLSSSTVRIHGVMLNKALNDAISQKLLQENPCKDVEKPQEEDKEMKTLSEEEVNRLLEATEDEWPYRTLYFLAIQTGMRLGELMGLKWDDINMDDGYIQVIRQLSRQDGYNFEYKPPKHDSKRRINLNPDTVNELKRLRQEQLQRRLRSQEWNEDELVFTTPKGEHLKPATMRQKLKKGLEESDGTLVPFHGLRHTCATLLLSDGVNPKMVSERLGHQDVSTTLEVYSHVIPDMQEEAAQALSGITIS
jgi:integrase